MTGSIKWGTKILMRENETSITFVDSMGVLAEIESETFLPRGNKRTK